MSFTPLTLEQVRTIRRLSKPTVKTESRYLAVWRRKDDEYGVTIGELLRTPPGAVESTVDYRFDFPAAGTTRTFERGDQRPTDDNYRCSAVELIYNFRDYQLSTLDNLAAVLRPGDALYVYFVIGNSTTTLKEAELAMDEAYTTVYRKGKSLVTFNVAVRVAPIYSSARMGS